MKKRHVLRWIILLLLLAGLAALIWFVYVPIYTKQDNTSGREIEMYAYSEAQSTYTLENEELLFTLSGDTTQFTVKNKKTGYEWHSNPVGGKDDKLAVSSEKEKLQSLFILSYATSDGAANTYNSFQYSTENGVYDIEQTEEEIKVHYTVGKVSKVFFIPTAITEARMNQFTKNAGMKKSDINTVTRMYRLYDPKKLKASEKDELLATYPDLNNEPVYIMLPKQKDNAKSKVEKLMQQYGYTKEEYQYDMSRVVGEESVTGAAFNVTLCYSLSGNELKVTVPFDDINYSAEYPITSLSLLPYMGAAGTDESGYMIVPEGGGSIITYNNGKTAQTQYSTSVYGWDYASDRTVLVSEPRSAYPVFCMTGGTDSFVCIMEDGASYATVKADISGRTNSYNYVYANYTILHRDMYQVSSKTTQRIYIEEAEMPQGTITQRYRFIDSDSYVDMANVYGEHLKNEAGMTKNASSQVPVAVDIIGAIDKTVKKLGLPVTGVVPLTTFEQAGQIVSELNSAGLSDLSVRLTGWANDGISQRVLTEVRPVREMGGEKALKEFVQTVKALGDDIYLDGVSEFAYRSGVFQGFNIYTDAAKYTTRERVKLYEFSPIFFTQLTYKDMYYLVKPSYMLKMAQNLTDAAEGYGASGVSYRDMGYLLSADYDAKNLTTREKSRKIQQDALRYASDKQMKTMIRRGNAYMYGRTDLITDMDLFGSGYSILDQSIPFVQIAIHGSVNYTGESLNMAGDFEQTLLRSAEYGAGLSVSFMYADADVLVDSNYTSYVSTVWSGWKDRAIDVITKYRADMNGLNDQKIVGHTVISQTLTCTEYENGTKVYVNYDSEVQTADGIAVPARSYLVKEGEAL